MMQLLSADKKGMGKIREANKPTVKSLERVDWQTQVWNGQTQTKFSPK